MKNRPLWIGVLVLSLALLLWLAYANYNVSVLQTWYDVTGREPAFRNDATLTIFGPDGMEKTRFDIELAKTESQQLLGLMFRRKMDADKGMLFLFEDEKIRAFWMKNTYMPLDIVFLSADSVVVHIAKAARVFSPNLIPSQKPAKFVLELNLGTWQRVGLREGDRVSLRSRR